MFRLDDELKVYVHRDAVDFRKSINGLAAIVEQSMKLDPFARAVYVFSNQRRDRIKMLLWDRNRFWLLMKRLERDRFVWPRKEAALILRQSNFTGYSRASTSKRCARIRGAIISA
ncbi:MULTISPECIES: IS66 family insertion sequence element accessory protein TnpB [Burkholderiaceae]|uniref:Mobile element protein n=1 Tax=Caballeronia sordidicola TaxID=196367 RepID=A0A242MLA2_CABSO|nr:MULTISPECIES: IS66 family insertion sequence element accessory protein TnpB [Burkholderiaceae]OTP72099.1 Mobile element protein [Caballeronia sordidicola]